MEDNNCLLSIIIPVYNVEEYIERCLVSISNQTYKNIEILCIDDGSKDNSGEICELFSKKDKRLKVFHTDNSGVGNARNYALKIISGDWFVFVDGDDWIEPDYISILLENAIKNNCDISACGYSRDICYILDNDEHSNNVRLFEDRESCIESFICGTYSLEGMCWNKIYRTNKFKYIDFSIDLKVNEDCIYTYDIMNICERACLTDAKLYHWFRRDNSASNWKNKVADFSEANVYLLLLEKTNALCNNNIEKSLKVNYVKTSTKILIKSEYSRDNSSVCKAKRIMRDFKKSVWNDISFKDKMKYVLVLHFPVFIKIVRKLFE